MANISVGGLVDIANNILTGVADHEDLINTIAGLAGVGPEVALAEKALPMVAAALKFMQSETGKGPVDVFHDFLNHITPSQPNSTALSENNTQGA